MAQAKVKNMADLSGTPKHRPFLNPALHLPTFQPGEPLSLLLLWPLGCIYLAQGYQREGPSQGSEKTRVLEITEPE